jgi:anti-anti-sigma factor
MEVESGDPAAVARVVGEIDVSHAATRAEGLRRALGAERWVPEVVVDLAQVRFLDARGLGAVLEGRRLARLSVTTVVWAPPSGLVRRMLGITGLAAVLPVRPVREEG